MRIKTMALAIAAATGLLVTGAVAQHEEHHQDQAAPPADKADAGKTGGMMSGEMMSQMMSQMPPMMMGQNDTAKLVDQLTKSFAAIEAEKNPTARKKKLAEHGVAAQGIASEGSGPIPHDGHDAAHDGWIDDGRKDYGRSGNGRTQALSNLLLVCCIAVRFRRFNRFHGTVMFRADVRQPL